MNSDYFLERRTIIKRLERYKFLFILICIILVIFYIYHIKQNNRLILTDYIAKIKIQGFISNNDYDADKIENLIYDTNVKAVLLIIDTHGGNIAESEKLYSMLRRLAIEKPTIAKIEGMAYSGGYLIATAADYIIGINSSTIGAISSIVHSSEIEDFSRVAAINPKIFLANGIPADKNYIKNITPEAEKEIENFITNINVYYQKIISERRNISLIELNKISNVIAYTGEQAKQVGLIDEVGFMTENWVKNWLFEKKNIPQNLEIRTININSTKEEDINVTDIFKRIMQILDKASKFII
ncbi:MAG: S49 family peptidase [Rickettsiales bacterium]